MQRKLIKQGADSYTLTIPKSWVREHNLKGGADISLDVQDDKLVLSAKKTLQERSTTIELPSKLFHTTLWYAVMSAYVAGYQEIILKPSSQTCILIDRIKYTKSTVPIAKALEEIMNILVGMEVLVQSSEKIVIREIASGNPDQLATTLNRSFYVLGMVLDETYSAMQRNDRQQVLKSFFATGNIHKLHQYCLRLLQQYGFQRQDRTVFVARLISALDEFANRLKVLLRKNVKFAKGDEELVYKLRFYLDGIRSAFQKGDVDAALLLMQEIKEVRITLKHKALKDAYDSLNALLQNVIEAVI